MSQPIDLEELRIESRAAALRGHRIGHYGTQAADEIERLQLGLVAITDETVTDIGELRTIARELLGWPARNYRG